VQNHTMPREREQAKPVPSRFLLQKSAAQPSLATQVENPVSARRATPEPLFHLAVAMQAVTGSEVADSGRLK
jgi:hypothetical protein